MAGAREYPDYPIAGVGVVVWKDGKVLLIRRGRAPREGDWSLPGGRQKLGETTRETAIREVREETGIEIELGHLLDVIDSVTPDGDGRVRYHFTLVDFDAEWRAGDATAGADAAAVTWADPADLDRFELWDETIRIIALSAELRGAALMSVDVAAEAPGRLRATLIGFTAVLMWSVLALLTTLTGTVPPFQLVAMAFAVAFTLALVKWIAAGENPIDHLRQRPAVWAVGIYGLFGFHAFYFTALRSAPPVEAGLIAYLAPLLIILLSALLPGERLRWFHLLGAAAGLAGAALLVTGGRIDFSLKEEFLTGYLAALACALIWSSYSVLSRKFSHVPTDIVGGYCGAAAVLGLLCHLAFETTVWPSSGEWLAVLGLGLGPVGASFFTWDYGCKRGDIKALGASMYAAPLLSTIVLIAFGKAALTWPVVVACVLITGGAVVASMELFRRPVPRG